MCQCPVSGYPHFYNKDSNELKCYQWCQCPISGYPHFYIMTNAQWKEKASVSMPYLGLSPFLQEKKRKAKWEKEYVSMPCLGLSPFLLNFRDAITSTNQMCQCPVSGYPHFYRVTSRNPHKQGAQFRNNTCNCQTIWFCSYFYSIFSFTWYFCSFSPEMVRLSTFLLYMFFYTDSRYFCFLGMLFYICISAIDISIPITP